LYARTAILAQRESVLVVGGGWARRAQAQPTVVRQYVPILSYNNA